MIYILTIGSVYEEDDIFYVNKFLGASKDNTKIDKLKNEYEKKYNSFIELCEKVEEKQELQKQRNIQTVKDFLKRNKKHLQEYNPYNRETKGENSWKHPDGTPYNPIIEDWEKEKLIEKLTTGINNSIHLFWPQYRYRTEPPSLSQILFLDDLEEELPDVPCHTDGRLPERPEGVYKTDMLKIFKVESLE